MSWSVLDTDMLSLFETGHPVVSREVLATPATRAITVMTIDEQLSGWYTVLRRAKNASQISWAYDRLIDAVRVVNQFEILPYSTSAVARFEQLKQMKLRIKAMDLRIAAIVLEHGGVLITRNRVDFARIPGLAIDDWSIP